MFYLVYSILYWPEGNPHRDYNKNVMGLCSEAFWGKCKYYVKKKSKGGLLSALLF